MGLRTTFRKFLWRHIGAYPVRVRGERFVCHSLQRRTWRVGEWEPETLNILDSRLSPDDVMWDIGAHVGQIALYASRKCRRVICFEPDTSALPDLLWNIARNRADNVTVVGAALTSKTDFVRMGSFSDGVELGRAGTSSRPSPTVETVIVPGLGPETWREWLRAEPPDFVKMDIEGGEFELLPAMADWLAQNRPKLALSLHAASLREAGRMSASEARRALSECASVLSHYGEFTEASTGQKFPISELVARKSGDEGDASIWLDGIYLE